MALAYAGIQTDQREVDLKNKPLDLIAVSPKATVPVLLLENGRVIDESLDIMIWALEQSDSDGWLRPELKTKCCELIQFNDTRFKPILDNYKYPQRSEQKEPFYHRNQAGFYLQQLNSLLMKSRYLLADHMTFADIAIFPFIRQFFLVDPQWFEQSEYQFLKIWLATLLNSELFLSVMKKS
jgi:glutathione S-transferase